MAKLSTWATEGLRPNLTLLLDIDPEIGLARAGDTPDRIEAESLEFHRRVRAEFLTLAQDAPGRYLVVAADQPAELVAAAVRARITELLPAQHAASAAP